MKNPWLRTPDDLKVILGVIDKLKSFDKYQTMVKRELAKVVHFQQFDDGRIVVQQGKEACSVAETCYSCVSAAGPGFGILTESFV